MCVAVILQCELNPKWAVYKLPTSLGSIYTDREAGQYIYYPGSIYTGQVVGQYIYYPGSIYTDQPPGQYIYCPGSIYTGQPPGQYIYCPKKWAVYILPTLDSVHTVRLQRHTFNKITKLSCKHAVRHALTYNRHRRTTRVR